MLTKKAYSTLWILFYLSIKWNKQTNKPNNLRRRILSIGYLTWANLHFYSPILRSRLMLVMYNDYENSRSCDSETEEYRNRKTLHKLCSSPELFCRQRQMENGRHGIDVGCPSAHGGVHWKEKCTIWRYLIRVSNVFRVLLLAITNLQISMQLEIELLGISIKIFSHLQDWVFNH